MDVSDIQNGIDYPPSLLLVREIEKAALPFRCLMDPEWCQPPYSGMEVWSLIESIANVRIHPNGNSDTIGWWLMTHPVEVAGLIAAIYTWKDKPIDQWKWPDLLIRHGHQIEPVSEAVEELLRSGGDDETLKRIAAQPPSRQKSAKEGAEFLAEIVRGHWPTESLPNAKWLTVHLARLRRRMKQVRRDWAPLFMAFEN